MMLEAELLELAAPVPLRKDTCESAECYGMGEYIREYGYYPKKWPLFVATDHGPSQRDLPTYLELRDPAPAILYHSARLTNEYRKFSGKPCFTMRSPFVYYRRSRKIGIHPDASGLLAFPVHTTDLIENDVSNEDYISELLSLPAEYHPISVCLHYSDILKYKHRAYLAKGIPVFTAGHIYRSDFIPRFYEILRHFKFTSSNHLGSYAFYSAEMGIPFFIHGRRPMLVNRGDPNCPQGKYDPTKEFTQLRKATDLFSARLEGIPEPQSEFVAAELGIPKGIGRAGMLLLLYATALTCFIQKSTRLLKRTFASLHNKYYFILHRLSSEGKIPTHLTTQEKIDLHNLLRKSRGIGTCLEIGSYLGASAAFICSALPRKGKLYCIDTWGNQNMVYSPEDKEVERDTLAEFRSNTWRFRKKIIEVRGWSHEVFPSIKEKIRSIDFLFIDGSHHYDDVKRDWGLYGTLLRTDGIVVFHDTGWAEGVKQVISESVESVGKCVLRLPNMMAFSIQKHSG